ncbi:hypothetical protein [Agreia sp. VKM Ac-1783]|uniref:hypothetical protein n=1 Tax=Agreia sp. VKM Ac-1783 TaxID=1938889 RepID=UPI000A2AD415|nr:hypothetical protein [Agreia sp. VKM Ac-1783]SMQ60964.1 hypothetical protein SAMN06295943_0547 [Agreia sp. VKM Ac-1783]
MIRRAGLAVNDTLGPAVVPPLAALDGFDTRLATDNVVSWGGDPDLYSRFFATSIALDRSRSTTEQPLPHTVLTLAALAAWRSGVLDLRQDALGRLTESLESGSVADAVLASALGLQAGELADFVRCQAESPFGWPARGSGEVVVARVGGFRGLGGPWTAPPASAEPMSSDGDYLITLADGGVWRLEADIFGTRLSRAETSTDRETARPVVPPASGAWPTRLAVFDTSYLAWLVLGQAA